MAKPIVALVGRPNVGKSTLFNKLAGRRISIVEDTPGVTRDRIYAETSWRGREFIMIDTGGIEPGADDMILKKMREQAKIAIESADVIIFLVDIKTGMTASDQDVAQMLLRSNKPIVLCVNKVDSVGQMPAEAYEFYNLGLGDPYPVSSIHGLGTGDLLDAVFEHFPSEDESEEENEVIKIAVIGKPNAGKSSIINAILKEDRVIVSPIAGTTRDAIDTLFECEEGRFMFIDTAGIRRKSKVDESIEKYSVLRAYMAVERSDVCMIVIDAKEGVTEQDAKIAGFAHEKGKASVIVVNKWDLVEKDTNTMNEFKKDVMDVLSFMQYAPIMFVSAKTGQRVGKLFSVLKYVSEQNSMRISTGMLNDILHEAMARVQPPTDKGKRLKILYMTQTATKPPTFVAFCNRADLFHFSYQRYIENQIREVFGMVGTPIRFIVRERGDKSGK
ncbi:MAG: ribosome biogenesis GTPase Der [Clostridia bacterium]|nr:ribosome biogenesis GTPase Der [Clostridia bacterium]